MTLQLQNVNLSEPCKEQLLLGAVEPNPLHHRALFLSRQHKRIESEFIQVLREIDGAKLFLQMGFSSLYQYCLKALELSESQACAYIQVMRKTKNISEFAQVIERGGLSVSKAKIICAAIDNQNVAHLIQFAKTHAAREIEKKVALIGGRVATIKTNERVKRVSESMVSVQILLTDEEFELLKRARDLSAQRGEEHVSLSQTAVVALKSHLAKYDPLIKARRIEKKRSKRELRNLKDQEINGAVSADKIANTDEGKILSDKAIILESRGGIGAKREVFKSSPSTWNVKTTWRTPFTAEQRRAIYLRDGGQCTHINAKGERCETRRHLHVHHIRPVSQGGGNEPSNCTTLCYLHHDEVHQLNFEFENGAFNWIQ